MLALEWPRPARGPCSGPTSCGEGRGIGPGCWQPPGYGQLGTRGSYWSERPHRSQTSREAGDSALAWDLPSLTLRLVTPGCGEEGGPLDRTSV